MKRLAATKTRYFFVVFSYIIFILVSSCESTRKINSDVLAQETRPEYQRRHHMNVQKKSHSPSSSSTPQGPRLIGLNVNGRVKCLLWNHPKKSIDSTLLPLFSSPCKGEHIVDESRHVDGIKPDSEIIEENTREKKQRRLGALFLPNAVYGTADYCFRKARWYGVEKVGTVFRWDLLQPWTLGNENEEDDRNEDFFPDRSRSFRFPTTLDVAAYRSISQPSKADTSKEFPSIIDSGNLCIGWHDNDERISFGVIGDNPEIQIGFDRHCANSDDNILMTSYNKQTRHPFYTRFFLPLIRRRVDLQWTSRWGDLSTRESKMGNQWPSDHRESNGDPWWIPQVNLDPSMGILTSENRHRKSFVGKDDRRYLTEFRFRIRTTMPTLLSSVTNNAMATYDGNDLEAASLRFECSLRTDPGERKHPFQGVSRTTARFETILVPSFWLRSVTETARLGLAHEQHHASSN